MTSGEWTDSPSSNPGADVQDGDTHAHGPATTIAFGPFRLDLGQRRFVRATDEGEDPVTLGSRAFDLLLLLAQRPGKLVSKDELMDAAWPGVSVEENNLSVQMSALRRALGDGPSGTRLIETVPGRGYRLRATVTEPSPAPARAPDPVPGPPGQALPPTAVPVRSRRVRPWHAVAAALLLAAMLAGTLRLLRGMPAGPASRPALSIVVLPFTTGGDSAYDHVAEGITDDLTTRISAIDGAFVIARGTASTFRGLTDGRSIAAQLGVRYLVEGSIRPLDGVTRVNTRLVEADGGATIWSDQFDSALAGLPAAQDAVVGRLASALGSRLVNAEAMRVERERPTDATALDLVLRARSILNLPQNVERNEQGTALLRQALARDPGSVEIMSRLGTVLLDRWTLLRDQAGSAERADEARALLERSAALDPRSFGVVWLRAELLRFDENWADACVAYQEAISLNPAWSAGYNQLALCALMLGHPEQAIPRLQQALRLDPLAPGIDTRYALMGQALLVLGRYEDAVGWLRRAIQAVPPPQARYRDLLAAALARAGLQDQAEAELRHALDQSPCMTVSLVRHRYVPASARAYRAAVADGLALAGLRDHAGVPGRVPVPPGRCDETTPEPSGVSRLSTDGLRRMLAGEHPPLLLTTFHADVVIPGTVWVSPAAIRPNAPAVRVSALRERLLELTGGDLDRQIVTIPWNVETGRRQPLAALAKSLGYRQVHSYADGLEAWIARDLVVETEHRRARPVSPDAVPP